MAPTTVDQVVLPILVAEGKLIDWLRPISDFVNQRFAQQIVEGAFGMIGDGDADAANLLFLIMNVVGAKEEIVLSVSFGDRRGPHRAASPGHLIGAKNVVVLGPMNQVR